MILSCPSCGTRYLVDPGVLGLGGRSVRCAKCAHTWRQAPPVDMPKRIDVLPPIGGPQPIPAGSNLPMLIERRRRGDRIGWLSLALAIAVVVVGGLVARDEIVSAWPATGKLYEALGFEMAAAELPGLKIRSVAQNQTVESGVPILVVTGEIENISSDAIRLPAVRIGLLDANEQELHHWTFAVETEELAAGAVTSFTTRLTSPPAGATRLSVRFATEGHG